MTENALSLDGVRFRWPGPEGFALTCPALQFAAGERVLLTGPSGSGKSTLLALIGGIVTPEAGQIQVAGTDLASLRASARDRFRAEQIGLLFQQFNLLPYASVQDNILLPLHFAPERRRRAGPGGTEAKRLATALGIGDLLKRRAGTLSVGQQQRVALARALIGAPPLILADEPTSALDLVAQEAFLSLLFAQLDDSRASLLMVSHDDRIAPHFDRVLVLADLVQTEAA